MSLILPRRRFLKLAGLSLSSLMLAGCDNLIEDDRVRGVIESAEGLTMRAQRWLLSDQTLAREFNEAELSPVFRSNGTSKPDGEDYARLLDGQFADWRLEVAGLVTTPQRLSLNELKAMPSRTQITRHDCVEGWSAIGRWTGVPLAQVLAKAGLKPEARFIVFECADDLEQTLDGTGRYYESIDLVDAFHPQTILAYGLNGKDLPVENGAPLRLRVERQLGYKQAKYIMRITAAASLAEFGQGSGGFWEDRGYEWYAGI
jgi:DMSO/TMAO reductase YedYZ molybdopterin-dependent catalytic subunit